jgi:hypothetical protein
MKIGEYKIKSLYITIMQTEQMGVNITAPVKVGYMLETA